MITTAALKNGFTGGVITDYPNSRKARKHYLFLMAGYDEEIQADAKRVIEGAALGDDGNTPMESVEMMRPGR